MPNMDGLTLVRSLRELRDYKTVPILLHHGVVGRRRRRGAPRARVAVTPRPGYPAGGRKGPALRPPWLSTQPLHRHLPRRGPGTPGDHEERDVAEPAAATRDPERDLPRGASIKGGSGPSVSQLSGHARDGDAFRRARRARGRPTTMVRMLLDACDASGPPARLRRATGADPAMEAVRARLPGSGRPRLRPPGRAPARARVHVQRPPGGARQGRVRASSRGSRLRRHRGATDAGNSACHAHSSTSTRGARSRAAARLSCSREVRAHGERYGLSPRRSHAGGKGVSRCAGRRPAPAAGTDESPAPRSAGGGGRA
jgi:hypothetical protein